MQQARPALTPQLFPENRRDQLLQDKFRKDGYFKRVSSLSMRQYEGKRTLYCDSGLSDRARYLVSVRERIRILQVNIDLMNNPYIRLVWVFAVFATRLMNIEAFF